MYRCVCQCFLIFVFDAKTCKINFKYPKMTHLIEELRFINDKSTTGRSIKNA